jgi:hypothetical protein
MHTSQRQVFPAITISSFSDYRLLKMPEFTVVLNEYRTFDIYIDGERCYFNLDTDDLKEFAQSFIDSNNA